MVSFLIYRDKPALQPILDTLRNGGFKPKFEETAGVEIITLAIAEGALDVILLFNPLLRRVSCQVVTVATQRQFAYYEDIVDKKDLLEWWFKTCQDINSRVLAAKAIEVAFCCSNE